MSRWALIATLCFFSVSCSTGTATLSNDQLVESAVSALRASDSAETLSSPASTVAPATSEPTQTQNPPSATPTVEIVPIVLNGSGTQVVNVEKPQGAMIARIIGNPDSRYFAVWSYGADGERIDLLVNTTDVYEGIVALDFDSDDHTTRFQVDAEGEWTIEVLPLEAARVISVPGTIEGSGDEVILVQGTPDVATIAGNAEERYFAIWAYGDRRDLLVNTTDLYQGSVIVQRDAIVMAITAEGGWSISITGP